MKLGDTFLGNLGYGQHLHVVISHPFDKGRYVIVTMISTYDADYKNATCTLRPSDGHPFIKHISCVAYNTAMTLRKENIERMDIKEMPPFSDDVMERILKGADANSSDFPNKFWLILDKQGLIP